MQETTHIRGQILYFLDNPKWVAEQQSMRYLADGVLSIANGKIISVASWQEKAADLSAAQASLIHYPHGLIMPGFIDTHVHYPQVDMIAADSAGNLLQWLENYTFPFEKRLHDNDYASELAEFFLDELIRNGTTTAMVFGSNYAAAVDALFYAAEARNMRLISGQVMTDINLPDYFIQDIDSVRTESAALIEKWHNKANTRLSYALTPRFAPTTSSAMFASIQAIKQAYPDVYVQSHLSENQNEVAWAKRVHQADSYLGIYDRYDLLSKNSIMAHGIYLTDAEREKKRETGAAIAFCPSSNLFLGSGLFDLQRAYDYQINVGLGTDVGAGTSFSLLQTLADAYKVCQLQGQSLSAFDAFYLITLGGAKALNLDDKLGNFVAGKEADFVVLDMLGATPLLQRRLQYTQTLSEKLFVLMTLADERSIAATYIAGQRVGIN